MGKVLGEVVADLEKTKKCFENELESWKQEREKAKNANERALDKVAKQLLEKIKEVEITVGSKVEKKLIDLIAYENGADLGKGLSSKIQASEQRVEKAMAVLRKDIKVEMDSLKEMVEGRKEERKGYDEGEEDAVDETEDTEVTEENRKMVLLAGDTNVLEMEILIQDMIRTESGLTIMAERGEPINATVNKIIEQLNEIDNSIDKYVILHGGVVDILNGTLRETRTKIVAEIERLSEVRRNKGVRLTVSSIPHLYDYVNKNDLRQVTKKINEAIRETIEETENEYLPLHYIQEEKGCMAPDGLHFSVRGGLKAARPIARRICDFLKKSPVWLHNPPDDSPLKSHVPTALLGERVRVRPRVNKGITSGAKIWSNKSQPSRIQNFNGVGRKHSEGNQPRYGGGNENNDGLDSWRREMKYMNRPSMYGTVENRGNVGEIWRHPNWQHERGNRRNCNPMGFYPEQEFRGPRDGQRWREGTQPQRQRTELQQVIDMILRLERGGLGR